MNHRSVWLLCALSAIALCHADTQQHSTEKHKAWFWETFKPDAAGPTEYVARDDWILATNIFFHVNRFVSLVPGGDASTVTNATTFSQFAHKCELDPLPLTDIPKFLSNIKAAWVSGTTLVITFPYAAFPHHHGWWSEVLAPVFSQLRAGAAEAAATASRAPEDRQYVRTVIIPNLRRSRVMSSPWVVQALKLAVAAGGGAAGRSPRLLFWDDLEAVPLDHWLGFERLLYVYNRHRHRTGGGRGFATTDAAAAFRTATYEAAGIPLPSKNAPPPRVITYIMPSEGSGVANNGEVLEALQEVAAAAGEDVAVRPYSPSDSVPMASFVGVMARTGVLVGRHGPLMANALLLPPGAAVVEILPFNWDFAGLSEVYRNLTASRGDVGHVAWRAPSSDWMQYASDKDARYGTWTPVECSTTRCLDAHNRAQVVVNTTALAAVVSDALAAVLAGEPSEDLRARHPWPARARLSGTSGLWYDK